MKAIVLLSAGLDSVVNMAIAIDKGYDVHALTFDYGQRAATVEVERSARLADRYNLAHRVIELPWLATTTKTSLVNKFSSVPDFDKDKIDDLSYISDTAKAVWVPNRNGVFINVAAAIAESADIDNVIAGFNAEEAVTFPDNSEDFMEAATRSLYYSTANHVKVISFTVDMDKREIVRAGRDLNVPFDLIWSCYYGESDPCGKCESCVRLKRALEVH